MVRRAKPSITAMMSAGDDRGERTVTESACGPVSGAFANQRPRQIGQVGDVVFGHRVGEFPVGVRAGEELGEHVGLGVCGCSLGQDAVLVAIPLEDGLDDQIAGVARHGSFERGEGCAEHRLDLVGLVEQVVDLAVGRLGRQHAHFEQHILLAGEVEVEQRFGDARGGADVGDGGRRIPLRAPQRHRGLHQRALGFARLRPLKRRATLTTVSMEFRAGCRHIRKLPD